MGKLRKNNTEQEETTTEKIRIKERSEGTTNLIERIQTVQLQLESDSDHTQLQDKVVDIDSLVEECFTESIVPLFPKTKTVETYKWKFHLCGHMRKSLKYMNFLSTVAVEFVFCYHQWNIIILWK